jgi:hypothetical protein
MRRIEAVLAVLVLSTFLAGCAPQVIPVTTRFNASEVEFIRRPGTAVVSGQGFMRQRGGGIVTCGGEEVRLIPFTEYSAERMTIFYGNDTSGFRDIRTSAFGRIPEPAPPEFLEASLDTRCDAQGNFSFENVPAGSYFVVTKVQWEVPTGYFSIQQGGHLMRRVTVADGQRVRVLLSN